MNKETKDMIAIIAACVMILFGIGLTTASFIVGKGKVDDSVLWVLGQALTYSGSIFGVSIYFRQKGEQITKEIQEKINSITNSDEKDK